MSASRQFALAASLLVTAALTFAVPQRAEAAAVLTHSYDLNGGFTDSLAGPSMVSNGGTLGAAGLTFGPGQGPNLSNAIDASTYSIELRVTLDQISGYRRIVDFKNRTSDTGFYDLNGAARFFNVTQGPAAFTAGQSAHVVLTRDNATDLFSAYVDGALQFSFVDSGGLAEFTGPDTIIHFMRDDGSVGGENTGGFLDYVRIYDGVLTSGQVLSLSEGGAPPGSEVAMPAPAPLALLGFGLIGIAASRRRRDRSATGL